MTATITSLAHGRDHLAIPGPSVMPDRVLRAMHRPAPNIYQGELVDITASIKTDLNTIAGNSGEVGIYIGNGHAAWEASLVNTFSRGDKVLFITNGRFGLAWADAASGLGIDVQLLDCGHTQAVDAAQLESVLTADDTHSIKAVLTVHTDTASSSSNDLKRIRNAIDNAKHPALYMVDSIASFACEAFHMDELGVDVMVTASQKGLMTPPGLALLFVGKRFWDYQEKANLVTPYWNARTRIFPDMFPDNFNGTPPTHHLFGLREALNMLMEEGIDNTWRRHALFAQAVWAAVEKWSDGGDFACNVDKPDMRSHAVTMVKTAPDVGLRLQQWCNEHYGVVLGVALAPEPGRRLLNSAFRIGHMGHLNPPMLLGTLSTIETGLQAMNIDKGTGAVDAAAAVLASAHNA